MGGWTVDVSVSVSLNLADERHRAETVDCGVCGGKDRSDYGYTQQKHCSALHVVQIPPRLLVLTSHLHQEIIS